MVALKELQSMAQCPGGDQQQAAFFRMGPELFNVVVGHMGSWTGSTFTIVVDNTQLCGAVDMLDGRGDTAGLRVSCEDSFMSFL